MSAYAGIVSDYNDMVQGQINEARGATEEGISDGLARQLENIKEKADEYTEKFSALAEGGIGEIAGLQGLKSTYKAVQDARSKWQKFRGDSSTDGRYLGGRDTADATAERNSLPDDVLGRVRRTLQGDDDLGVGQLERTGITTSRRGELRARAERQRLEQVDEPDVSDVQAQIDAQPPAQEVTIAGGRDDPVNITDDQLDSMVSQARDDVNEGVGVGDAPTSYSVQGIQYGKTGSGADVKRPPVSEPDSSPASNPTLDSEPQVSVSQPSPSTEPIPVSKIGVKASAEEFSARADQSAQAIASVQPDDLKSVVRAKYQALSDEDKQNIASQVRNGEINGDDFQAISDGIDKLRPSRPPPALAEDSPQVQPSTNFLGDIEQAGRSAEASVRGTADPVRFRTAQSEGAQLTAEERGAIQPEFIQGARADLQATARTGLRRLLGFGGAEGEVSGAELLGSIATPIGEAVAVGAGIVSVVDGLVHLFHPPHNTPKPLGHLGNIDPQVSSTLTSKYASAIPTLDNAHEVGGFASF